MRGQGTPRILVLGLGNDLISDDGVGLAAARALRPLLEGRADVVESSMHGLALLDLFIGYDCAVVLDAIVTGRKAPGTIREITTDELDAVVAPSPHFAGFPEMLEVARRTGMRFPADVRILAVEVSDAHTIREGLCAPVRAAIEPLVARTAVLVDGWLDRQPTK